MIDPLAIEAAHNRLRAEAVLRSYGDMWRTGITQLDVFRARDLAMAVARETEAIRDGLLAEIAYKRQHPWRSRWVTVRKWVGKR